MKNKFKIIGLMIVAFFVFTGFSSEEVEAQEEEVSINASFNVFGTYIRSDNRIVVSIYNGPPNTNATLHIRDPRSSNGAVIRNVRLNSSGHASASFNLPSNASGTWRAGGKVGNHTTIINVQTR
ncbi:hypothetical protein [Shouchella miscanthi]|uniref:Uncharacterized protein n=1 Tax=Shouchella miscanthi TaxID=2598861 RepID=A0ABU6NF43_9BACI|nr:hypothetical protein [Shouchella miscanthi]